MFDSSIEKDLPFGLEPKLRVERNDRDLRIEDQGVEAAIPGLHHALHEITPDPAAAISRIDGDTSYLAGPIASIHQSRRADDAPVVFHDEMQRGFIVRIQLLPRWHALLLDEHIHAQLVAAFPLLLRAYRTNSDGHRASRSLSLLLARRLARR